jgi:hypothetical protein
MSHHYELNLVKCSHMVLYHEYIYRLRKSAAEQPVLVPVSSSLHTEDRGSMVLRNFGILPYYYTALQPKRLWLESYISYSARGLKFSSMKTICRRGKTKCASAILYYELSRSLYRTIKYNFVSRPYTTVLRVRRQKSMFTSKLHF